MSLRGLRHAAAPAAARAAGLAALVACAGLAPVARAAAVDPGPPGPPPGAGTDRPLPPPPGAAPAAQPSGPATTIPGTSAAPGLRSGVAQVSGDAVDVGLACRGHGSASLRDATVTVRTRYSCRGGSGRLRFPVTRREAGSLTAGGGTVATITLTAPGSHPLTVAVNSGPATPAYWTSTFGLRCTAGGADTASLSAPNFSVSPTTTIDVRPWLAWYTPRTGWQWMGLQGPWRSRWLRWSASPTGVLQWQNTGTTIPWSWTPIAVAPGHATRVVAVFETLYWYSHPVDVWRDAYTQPGSSPDACAYP